METFWFIISVIVIIMLVIVCLPKEDGRSYGNTDSYAWKSQRGRNMVYEQKLADPRWRQKRSRIVERDHYTCQWCGSHENLQVHHKYYMRYPDGKMADLWDYPDEKLITLCENCHRKWHEKHKANVYYRKWGVHYE